MLKGQDASRIRRRQLFPRRRSRKARRSTTASPTFWIVTNRKAPERRGKFQLADERECFTKMRKSLGEKRKEISDAQIDEITRPYADFEKGERVKILPNEAFGFLRITVERPAAAALRGHRRDH